MKFLYLFINLGAVIIPFIFSFHTKIRFYKHFKAAFSSILSVALAFIVWDFIFTEKGVWGFNSAYLLGFNILNLPFEEVLFFICIPFSCLFTYFVFRNYLLGKLHFTNSGSISIVAFIILVITAFINLERLYTSSVLFLSALALMLLFRNFRKYFEVFFTAFLVLLLPFLVVNGILTGTGIPGEVVWYNNTEIMGIRILSIPLEDFFYAFVMISANFMLFEKFSSYFYGSSKA